MNRSNVEKAYKLYESIENYQLYSNELSKKKLDVDINVCIDNSIVIQLSRRIVLSIIYKEIDDMNNKLVELGCPKQ